MPRNWRVGIIGLGHWYSAFGLARALGEYPKATLVGIAGGETRRRNEYARTFGITAHGSVKELLARDDLDIVHICPPVDEIPAATVAAARAGKHIILGKPMAMTVAQADDMVAAVRAAKVVCVPFQGMFRVTQAALKKRLDSGEIGDIVVIHATGRWSIAEDWFHSGKPGWFADPAHVPGGAFIDEGIFSVDQLRWLAGSEVVRVEAKMANFVHKDIEVEDWGMATFTYANGVIATLEASWTINSPRKSGPSPKVNSLNRLEVVGTRGEIIQENLRVPGLAVLGAGAAGWTFERPGGDYVAPLHPTNLDYLIECLEKGVEPESRIEDARVSLRTALAAYQSARTGMPVTL